MKSTRQPIIFIILGITLTIFTCFGCKEVDKTQKAEDYYEQQSEAVFSKGPENPSVKINNGDATTDSLQATLSLSATDNIGITGYYTSQSSSTPSLRDSDWVVVMPAETSFQIDIKKTLRGIGGITNVYAWFKDEEGNVSDSSSDSIIVLPGITVSQISGNTSESGTTGTFSIRLNTQPNGTVVIDANSSDISEGIVSPSSLTFDNTNWDLSHIMTITGVDDFLDDGNHNYVIQLAINGSSTTDTTGYATLDPDDVSITNIDNDTLGYDISSISGNTSELGTTAMFTIKLNTQPSGNVVINVMSSDTSEGTVTPTSLTFDSANWNSDQTVTVTGVNDSLDDGDTNYVIQLVLNSVSTTDTSGYAVNDPDDVNVINTEWVLSDTGQTNSYIATYGEDSDYLINPPSFTNNGNGTVTDNNNSLIWQREDDKTMRSWSDAGTYCDNLVLGGQSEWRLPSDWELLSIVNYGVDSPSIDILVFPNTRSSCYWSSITHKQNSSLGWCLHFDRGQLSAYDKTNSYNVRCVKGGVRPIIFTDNGNGIVTENITHLEWQKEDNDLKYTWEAAINYCEGLSLAGQTDWRLPNIRELSSILDSSRFNPAIDLTYFPNTNSSGYWSSTTGVFETGRAWYIYFYTAQVLVPHKTESNYVRCVRDGQ